MAPGFPFKTLLAWAWLIPAVALTIFSADRLVREIHPPSPPPPPERVKVPVEMIEGDEKARIVYVELETESIPEPSVLLFVPLSALVLMRRRR